MTQERCRIIHADVLAGLRQLPNESVHCVITSPPYWGLRDYGVSGQLGLEPAPEAHICAMLEVFREVWRVLRRDGTLFLNYGDCYAGNVNGRSAADTKLLSDDDRTFRDKPFGTVGNGLKPKDLVGMPWRVALALQADGWYLRSASPWVKRSAMPESVTDRPPSAVEYVFLLAKSQKYYFDAQAVRRGAEYGRREWTGGNGHFDAVGIDGVRVSCTTKGSEAKRGHANGTLNYADRDGEQEGASSRHGDALGATAGRGTRAWRNSDFWFDSVGMLLQGEEVVGFDVNPAGFPGAHFATFPEDLVRPCVLAGSLCGMWSAVGARVRRRKTSRRRSRRRSRIQTWRSFRTDLEASAKRRTEGVG